MQAEMKMESITQLEDKPYRQNALSRQAWDKGEELGHTSKEQENIFKIQERNKQECRTLWKDPICELQTDMTEEPQGNDGDQTFNKIIEEKTPVQIQEAHRTKRQNQKRHSHSVSQLKD